MLAKRCSLITPEPGGSGPKDRLKKEERECSRTQGEISCSPILHPCHCWRGGPHCYRCFRTTVHARTRMQSNAGTGTILRKLELHVAPTRRAKQRPDIPSRSNSNTQVERSEYRGRGAPQKTNADLTAQRLPSDHRYPPPPTPNN